MPTDTDKPPCRVCTDFRQTMRSGGFGIPSSTPPRSSHSDRSQSRDPNDSYGAKDTSSTTHINNNNNENNYARTTTTTTTSASEPIINNPAECPPDSLELGHSSWTLLHSIAAYYPKQPDQATQQQCLNFLGALPTLYPCSYCAKHLGEEMQRIPPRCESRESLEQWMCKMHNIVNERLGKPEFDCSKVGQRWRDGC